MSSPYERLLERLGDAQGEVAQPSGERCASTACRRVPASDRQLARLRNDPIHKQIDRGCVQENIRVLGMYDDV